ncbi:hypothetical protein Tco_1492658 [Tanacetum coccineum]
MLEIMIDGEWQQQQMVKGIMIDEEWITDPHRVKMAFFKFYKDKFENHDSEMNLGTVTPQVMLDPKSARSGWFFFSFLETYWELFKSDVEASVRNFFVSSVMPKGMNSSFITLILKVPNPIHIKDYPPISLIEWNSQDMENIIRELHVFYLSSPLKLNTAKSNVYKVGVSSGEIRDMDHATGCALGSRNKEALENLLLEVVYISVNNSTDSWQ